jgi:hypothetical protein
MLKLKPLGEPQGRSMVQIPIYYFHCAYRFVTRILAHMLDSLVRVSRRVGWNHFVSFHWLRLYRGYRLGDRASKLSQSPGSTVGTVELTSKPHSAQGFSQQLPEGSPPEFSPRAKPS